MLEPLKVTISKQANLRRSSARPAGDGEPGADPAGRHEPDHQCFRSAGGSRGFIAVHAAHVRDDPDAPNERRGGFILLEVSDAGCGMTPDIQARIFDPFFTTKFSGRGLGLAAAQGIIRRHGGLIRVASETGRGSRFEILLPCTSKPAGAATTTAASPDPIAGTCFVVEDEEALRNAVSQMLRKRGFTVIEASDGKAAVEFLRTQASEIDVVLLDLTLPGMSGREVFVPAENC